MKVRDWSIARKLGAGFGAVAAVFLLAVVALLVFAARAQDDWRDTQRWDVATRGVMLQLTGIRMQMAAQASFAATLDPTYKQEFRRGVELATRGSQAVAAVGDPVIASFARDAEAADRLHDQSVTEKLFPATSQAAAQAALLTVDGLVRVPLASAEKIADRLAELRAEDVAEADSAVANARTLGLLAAGLGALIAAAVALLSVRSITRRIGPLVARLESLEAHDLASLEAGLDAVARGDLTLAAAPVTKPIEDPSACELGRIAVTLNRMLDRAHTGLERYEAMRGELRNLVGAVGQTAGTLSSASQQMACTSEEAGRAVGEIAKAVAEVASGADRQVRMIDDARRSAEESSLAAGEARRVAEDGAGAVDEATAAMHAVRESSQAVTGAIRALGEKSQQIGGIVETITGIAGQTNLLALNAAIEAARAGEQGRGFAVVAEEVRKLAEEARGAAASIAVLVQEIQSETQRVVSVVEDGARRTDDGTSTVEEARTSFVAIAERVEDMSARIDLIAAATGEVAAVAEQSSASTQQVSASTEQTTASAQQIAASAQELARTAAELEQLFSHFRLAA